MDGSKVYYSRYSPKTVTVSINPAFAGYLPEIPVQNHTTQQKENVYDLHFTDKGVEMAGISQQVFNRTVKMDFSPFFPDIRLIQNGQKFKGNFSILSHTTTGCVSGEYSLEKREGVIYLSMQPSNGWRPYKGNRFAVKAIFSLAKVFHNWPKTYRWSAEITSEKTGGFSMVSKWERVKK